MYNMDTAILLAIGIVLTVFLLIFIYVPDFFNMETIAIVAVIISLLYILNDDNSLANNGMADKIYGGQIVHTHENCEIDNDGLILGGGANAPYMKMDLMDPKHNLREIAKQLILLEDHMAHKNKRCVDCITKHYLMVEGLLEEAITLDKTAEHVEEVRKITEQVKPAVMSIIDLIKHKKISDKAYHETCQVLRTVRKEIALKYVLNN